MPTKLIIPKEPDPYAWDIERIVKVCAENDYEITADVARKAWENYSESMAAGWMSLPNDDRYLLNTVLCWTEAA